METTEVQQQHSPDETTWKSLARNTTQEGGNERKEAQLVNTSTLDHVYNHYQAIQSTGQEQTERPERETVWLWLK